MAGVLGLGMKVGIEKEAKENRIAPTKLLS